MKNQRQIEFDGIIEMKRKIKQLNIDQTIEKINSIVRHIRNVQENCLLLGTALIQKGEIDVGRKLVASGFRHDNSKFEGIEFEYLTVTQSNEETAKLKLRLAVHHHSSTNDHHPEAWGTIHRMPRIAVAEMVCDWKSRSEEFGTSVRDYIDNQATKRFGFSKDDKVYKEIEEFVNLLCPKPFEPISQG